MERWWLIDKPMEDCCDANFVRQLSNKPGHLNHLCVHSVTWGCWSGGVAATHWTFKSNKAWITLRLSGVALKPVQWEKAHHVGWRIVLGGNLANPTQFTLTEVTSHHKPKVHSQKQVRLLQQMRMRHQIHLTNAPFFLDTNTQQYLN